MSMQRVLVRTNGTLNLSRKGIEVCRVHHVVETDVDGLLEAIPGKRLARKESRRKPTDAADGWNGGEAMGI